ncbi:MAG: c-type cytochrome [Thermoanaerobaculia bacterium]
MHKELVLVALTSVLLLGACGEKPQQTASTEKPARPRSGKDIYEYRCAFCHGVTGAGDSPTGSGYPNANLTDATWAYGQTREDIARTIANGVPGTPMRGFTDVMSKEELDAVTDYVMHLNGK